jgi:leader peptidase (prepilin peptidase)/N-methyltransferase
MIRILGTIFAGLLGLAFGSFLDVCLTRWPQGESIVHPRSHCRNCDHALAWWENIPLISWLALRGRCRNCHTSIGWRYPLVEFAVGALWALLGWDLLRFVFDPDLPAMDLYKFVTVLIGKMILYWLLIALAVLDAENLWLPDLITIPGILLGLSFTLLSDYFGFHSPSNDIGRGNPMLVAPFLVIAILAAAALILVIRWLYKLIRHREGIGLGDVKLMALLAAWLGLPGALLSFGVGVILGTLVAVVLLIVPTAKLDSDEWSLRKLPLGTFLCIGGIISSLWGQPIIAAYLHWAGF